MEFHAGDVFQVVSGLVEEELHGVDGSLRRTGYSDSAEAGLGSYDAPMPRVEQPGAQELAGDMAGGGNPSHVLPENPTPEQSPCKKSPVLEASVAEGIPRGKPPGVHTGDIGQGLVPAQL